MLILKLLFIINCLGGSLTRPNRDDKDVVVQADGNNIQQGVVTNEEFERENGDEGFDEDEKEGINRDNNGVGMVIPDDIEEDSNQDNSNHDNSNHDNSNHDNSNHGNNYHDNNDDNVNLPDNGQLFEGDIVMDERFRRMVGGEESKKSAVAFLDELDMLWPGGVIIYEIDEDFPANQREMLNEAMTEYENRTCISFKYRTNEPKYVYFTDWKDECSSNIGMSGGRQNITLGRDCHVLGTYEHEIMHALGFIHEHSRPDRDEYIKIVYSSIKKEEWPNFQKYKFRLIQTWNMTFNFESIMLYRNNAFTKDGNDTIKAITEPDLKFGQRIKFSAGDVKEINTLYNCTKYLEKPNYHGLIKDYHTRKRKKDAKYEASEEKINKKENSFDWMWHDVLRKLDEIRKNLE